MPEMESLFYEQLTPSLATTLGVSISTELLSQQTIVLELLAPAVPWHRESSRLCLRRGFRDSAAGCGLGHGLGCPPAIDPNQAQTSSLTGAWAAQCSLTGAAAR